MDQLLLDSHAHLDDLAFDADRDEVMARARDAGVRMLLAIGGANGPDSMGASVPLAEAHDWIWTAAGVHPHESSKAEERHYEELRALAHHPRFIAVGEIGLDFHYDHSPREVQRQVLIRQLEIACEVKLPIIIHCRDAWTELRAIAEAHWKSSGLGGILHCFSGTRDDAFALLDQGFLVSFAGNLTFKKADDLRAVARDIPLDRLLTETDCPYLAPVPHRGRRNEPAFVAETTRELARLRRLSEAQTGTLAIENFRTLFKLA